MNTHILSAHTGEPVAVRFAMVGKGKAVHYSTDNDDTLCGKGVSRYVDGNTDAALCKPCARIERVKSAEYAEWLERHTVPAETDAQSVSPGTVYVQGDEPSTWAPDFDAFGASDCYFTSSTCEGAPVAVFVDYVGRTEGLCSAHRHRVAGQTYDVPATAHTDAESVSYPAPVIADGMDTRFMTSEEKAEAFARVERAQAVQDAASTEMANAPESDWMYRANGLDAHTCDETDCITCIVRDMNREDSGFTVESLSIGDAIRFMENGNVETVTEISRMETGMYEIRTQEYHGAHVVSRHMPLFLVSYAADAPDGGWQEYTSTMTNAGFVETMVTKEYELSVIVDETTGTRVSLGWVTLTMNAAQCMDFDRVAEEYGRTQNTRTPRHGWASIITVHDVADI